MGCSILSLDIKNIGRKIIAFEEIESTNLEAKKLALKEKSGTVIIAERQTNGRGRLGRSWASSQNDGLYLSVIIKGDIPPYTAAQMTVTTGYCVCTALRKLTDIDLKIKWPNDIISGNKKLCGILTEMSSHGESIDYAVIGIGINVLNRSFDEDISAKATSLYIESGKEFSKNEVLHAVITELDKHYGDICSGLSESIITPYTKLCATIGREIKLMRSGKIIIGTAIGINKNGELIIDSDGQHMTVSGGEVTVQGIY